MIHEVRGYLVQFTAVVLSENNLSYLRIIAFVTETQNKDLF